MTNDEAHWQRIYAARRPDETSWYQPIPTLSLELVDGLGLAHDAPIVDIGGGASTLVDHLVARGYAALTVVDLAANALEHAKGRLGAAASTVEWIAGDVLEVPLGGPFALWHDRAVFHFLTDAGDREVYRRRLREHLCPGGHVILATFADDGPERCSGLPVVRHSEDALFAALGPGFSRKGSRREVHRTPGGVAQRFVYVVAQREG
ncbi:MAG: class I SAM-dependent methyltransferase [Myxococcales bacterium]|nr:class I SAM-dependent methyltransferase [Myxococcales bacterium]